jgi:predicted ArsR family transcriptional regulator
MNRSAFHRMSDDKRARIEEIAARDPDLKVLQIAARLGLSAATVRKTLGPEESARRNTRRGAL